MTSSIFVSNNNQALLLSRYASAVITLILLAMLFFQMTGDFAQGVTSFGTWRSPYSDALAPWLHGALNYLFYGEPHGYLYRPTIGVFFGSVISVTDRIEAISVFFAVLAASFLLLAIPQSDPDLRLALLAWLFIAALNYMTVIQSLNFENLMPDLPAFVFTLAGFYLVLISIRASRTDRFVLAIGFLAIGVAATIRGPMMLAGLTMLSLLYAIMVGERRLRLLLPAAMLFLLPISLDIVSQRIYGVINNGVMTMFCFYTEPSYTWTTPCQTRYLEIKPKASIVIANYIQTLLSKQGFSIVIGNLGARIHAEGQQLRSGVFWGTFFVTALLQCWVMARNHGWRNGAATVSERFCVLMRDRHFTVSRIILVALTGLVAHKWGSPATLVMTLSVTVLFISLGLRLYRPMLAVVAYWVGAIFLALMTQAQQDRLGLTFSFTLYLAIFLCVCDRPRVQKADLNPPIVRWLARSTVIVVLFLYFGVFLFPSQWRVIYQSQVEGRTAALKISEDRDRCLYFTGARDLVYVTCDRTPIGSVRQYSKIEAPAGLWNGSYQVPARFVP
jgi:hypothetical protein